MNKKLTLYDLKRLQEHIHLLNVEVGLPAATMKDVARAIKQEIDKIKSEP